MKAAFSQNRRYATRRLTYDAVGPPEGRAGYHACTMTWRNSLGLFEAFSCRERSSQSNLRVPMEKDPVGDGSARVARDWHGAQTLKHEIRAIRRLARKIAVTMRLDDGLPIALSSGFLVA